jgi:hypothetical protein
MNRIFIAAIALGLSAGALPARADDQWQEEHPRREQVNERLKRQNERITEGEESGTLTHRESKALRGEDRRIRKQERQMAAQNGGHITKAEQRALNQEENRSSEHIREEKREGAERRERR